MPSILRKAEAPSTASTDAVADAAAIEAAIVFLARCFGTTLRLEPLRAELALALPGADAESWRAALRNAGLVPTALTSTDAARATSLPALALAPDGRVRVVLGRDAEGRWECHDPGIDGSRHLEAAQIDPAQLRWIAVRPALHFDERSLLYTLPRGGRWFWDAFDRNRWVFRWALAGTVGVNVFSALVPFYTMAVYDRVIPNNAVASLWVLTIAALALIGFELAMRLVRSHLVEHAARRMDVALSAQVFARCLRLRAAERPASGGVLANTVRDFEAVREFFASATLTVLGDLPFVLLFLGVIALVGGWLAIVPMVFIPLLFAVALAARGPLARHVNESMRESSQRTAHLFETMNGLDTVKAIGAEAWSRRKWEGLTTLIAQNTLETRETMARVTYINNGLQTLASVAVVAVGALLYVEHALTLGQIIAVSLLTSRALSPIGQAAGLIVRWQQTRLSYEALERIMQSPTDDHEASLQAPALRGAIEFRDVGFAYPKTPPLLERLNLQVRAGEKVGVIGRLGSGKSTLLRLILNQYAPTAGSVLVDDLATTQLEPLSLRRQIGYVPQDVVLFHGTVRENIELGRVQPDDAALVEAMRDSGLDEVVAALPGGLDTPVGERGERLSGGQRQAVSIARALLARPRLLLLDEPSSMFDPASERRLITRLRAMKDTTIVLVTHRMAMLALVDRLVVMDRGRVVADGPRDEVLRALALRDAAEAGSKPRGAGAVEASMDMGVAK